MSKINIDYKIKYLKYKEKYLNLQNMIGSGYKSAESLFYSKIKSSYPQLKSIFESDAFLSRSIDLRNLPTSIDTNDSVDLLKQKYPIFITIFDFIKAGVDSDPIQILCEIYLKGGLGSPNSIENKGRLIDSFVIYNDLPAAHKKTGNFNTLLELELYIQSKQSLIEDIARRREEKVAIKQKKRQVLQEGVDDVEIIFENPKVRILRPISEAGSKLYGNDTRWCTAASSNNMFNYYNGLGPIYIIEINKDKGKPVKYQMHVETMQLMDSGDNPTDLKNIIREVDDEDFTRKLYELIDQRIELSPGIHPHDDQIDSDLDFYILFKSKKYHPGAGQYDESIATIKLPDDFNEPLGDLLYPYIGLKNLYFGNKYNQPLGESLSHFQTLRRIKFGDDFNQPLGDSLKHLDKKLWIITFGNDFNQPLDDSIPRAVRSIIFGSNYDKPLVESLGHIADKLGKIVLPSRYRTDEELMKLLENNRSGLQIDWI